MRHELWKSRKRKQRISNRREMRLTLCFLLHHSRRKIVSIAVEFGHTTRRRVVPRENASATAVKYGHYAKCCTQKSRATRNSRKGKQPRGRGNQRKRKNRILTDWKQNVRNVRPCQPLMTSIHSG